jgi:hypothetical protein
MRACAWTVSDQDRDVTLRRHTSNRALLEGYKALLIDVNGYIGRLDCGMPLGVLTKRFLRRRRK